MRWKSGDIFSPEVIIDTNKVEDLIYTHRLVDKAQRLLYCKRNWTERKEEIKQGIWKEEVPTLHRIWFAVDLLDGRLEGKKSSVIYFLMKDKHTATFRTKQVISSCLFWSKLKKCASHPFWANTNSLTYYFHQKTNSTLELGAAVTKFCFLKEEHTFSNICSVLLEFFQSIFYQKDWFLIFP